MQFKLYKTRVFTDYNQIKRLLGTSQTFLKTFKDMTAHSSDIKIVNLTSLNELNMESATVHYQLELDSTLYELKVFWMQSTPSTTSCFDIFIQVYSADNSLIKSNVFNEFLESLRVKFNGNWRIQDHELNQSILK
jgi:hypothetical protein